MTHHLMKSGYTALVDRINRFPQGATPSDTLNKILNILFTEKDAGLVSLLPIKPFTTKNAAHIWKMKMSAAQKILDDLANRAILLDIGEDGEQTYVFPPPWPVFLSFLL